MQQRRQRWCAMDVVLAPPCSCFAPCLFADTFSMCPSGQIAAMEFESLGTYDDSVFVQLCSSLRMNTRLRCVGLAANAIGGYFGAPRTRTSFCRKEALSVLSTSLGPSCAVKCLDLRGNELSLSDDCTFEQLRKLRYNDIDTVI